MCAGSNRCNFIAKALNSTNTSSGVGAVTEITVGRLLTAGSNRIHTSRQNT